jgi:predicted PurR-regulated permease PerM
VIIILLILAIALGILYALHHVLILIVLAGILYLAFHGAHSRRHWNRNGHRSFLSRVWVSIPGPFHTRIGRRM